MTTGYAVEDEDSIDVLRVRDSVVAVTLTGITATWSPGEGELRSVCGVVPSPDVDVGAAIALFDLAIRGDELLLVEPDASHISG